MTEIVYVPHPQTQISDPPRQLYKEKESVFKTGGKVFKTEKNGLLG
jgi:hypothetical protein